MIRSVFESIDPDVKISDPTTYLTLPFPSTFLVSRFDSLPATGTLQTFKYMDRSKFGDIQKEVENPHFLRGLCTLYLNGPSSIGKSYMLAVLVCHLIRLGKYVVYIPDRGVLLEHAEENLRCALQLSFHRDRDLCSQLSDAQLTDDRFRIIEEHAHKSLYVVLISTTLWTRMEPSTHSIRSRSMPRRTLTDWVLNRGVFPVDPGSITRITQQWKTGKDQVYFSPCRTERGTSSTLQLPRLMFP